VSSYDFEVVVAASPAHATDSGLISAVNCWARIWAFTPRYRLWARWIARRAVIRTVREIRRREEARSAKLHECYSARQSVDPARVRLPSNPSALKR